MTSWSKEWSALARTASRAWRNASARNELAFLEEAATRLAQFGPNRIQEERPPNPLVILLHQFQSPLVVILLLADGHRGGEYVDAGVIAAVLILNAAIGFFQEREADRSVRSLPSWWRLGRGWCAWGTSERSTVGMWYLATSSCSSPVAGSLPMCVSRRQPRFVDESLLTGESVPVAKGIAPVPEGTELADRTDMAHAGTVVASGRAWGYAIATGPATALGAIATRMREVETVEPPCSAGSPASRALLASSRSCRARVCLALPAARPPEMFKVAVALAVAAVPEGLPIAVTVALAVGVRRMAHRNAVIRQLSAVEALGSATMIGSDKTGTLTENQMTVQQIWTGGRIYRIADGPPWSDGLDSAALPATQWPLYLTLLAGVLTNEATVAETEAGFDPGRSHRGRLADRGGAPRHRTGEARDASPVLAEIPFEPARQYSASVRQRDDEQQIFVKGAPERVLAMCDTMLGEHGIGPLVVEQIRAATRDLADQGLRVLAMAYRPLPQPPRGPDTVVEPGGLTFLGLQGMVDPPRAGVREAIASCHAAGVRAVMITGDHAATAQAIGVNWPSLTIAPWS